MNAARVPGTAPRDGLTFIEAARRAQIIDCAIAAIAELGYARASLAEIAKRAGISKSVISYHFAGKDDLIRQVVTGILERGMAAMEPAVGAQPGARAKLRAYVTANLEYMREHPTEIAALVAIFSANRGGDETPLIDEQLATAGAELATRIIRDGQATGEFRQCSAQIVAISLRASLDMVPPYLAAEPSMDLDRYATELIALFERGLGVHDAAMSAPPEPGKPAAG